MTRCWPFAPIRDDAAAARRAWTRMSAIWAMRCCSSSFRPDIAECHRRSKSSAAAASTIPNVPVLFWSFRFMVAIGFWFIALFAAYFWFSARRAAGPPSLVAAGGAFFSLPLPWIAAELGWIVAEYGRQPWVIEGVLPTALGVSSTAPGNVLFSLLGFALFYSALLVADLYLLVKYIRLGPDDDRRPSPEAQILVAAE